MNRFDAPNPIMSICCREAHPTLLLDCAGLNQIFTLVVQLGFEPSLRVSKTPVQPIHHWTFVKGFQSDHIGFRSCIHGLATSDIVPVLVAFSRKPIRTRQSSVLPMWLFYFCRTFCTACLYRIENKSLRQDLLMVVRYQTLPSGFRARNMTTPEPYAA